MWQWIKKFFRDSETLFLARLQMFLGAAAELLTYVPAETWAPILPPQWFGWFLLVNGVATEWLRRRRANDL